MKVLNNNRKNIETEKSGFNGVKVLKNLILKAEKRKSFAENFRIYAVMQSTITRLKLDNSYMKVKNISCNVRFGNTCSVEGMNSDKCYRQSVSLQSSNIPVDDQDPLNLNTFFEELKNR